MKKFMLCILVLVSLALVACNPEVEESKVKLLFYSEGGSEVTEQVLVKGQTPQKPDEPTKKGHTFLGWYADLLKTQEFDFDAPLEVDTIAYASWQANTYTVTLDRQGGIAGSASIEAVFGQVLPQGVAPTRSKYAFDGYYAEKNGGGTKYYDEDMVGVEFWDIDQNTTLYANWVSSEATDFTVSFDKQGGSGGSDSVTAIYGLVMPAAIAPAKSGASFDGYYTEKNGAGVKYYDKNMVSVRNWDIKANTTLYAKWVFPDGTPVVVVLDFQGGLSSTAMVVATVGEQMPLAIMPTKNDFDFGGYFTLPFGQGVQYYDNEMNSTRAWDIGEATTLYAYWLKNRVLVSFDKQGGSGGILQVNNVIFGQNMPFISVPLKTGYNFMGYFSEQNGQGTKYYDSKGRSARQSDLREDTTLYAHWQICTTQLTLNANGGDMSKTVVATYGQNMPSITTAPQRDMFTFLGYYANQSGELGKKYYNADLSSATYWDREEATFVIYARWQTVGASEDAPYVISTKQQLVDFATRINNGQIDSSICAALGANIDLQGVTWTPIRGFTGVFDGKGKEISNLTINYSGNQVTENVGFFADNCGLVKALSLVDLEINVHNTNLDSFSVGAIAGISQGVIYDCAVTGNVNVVHNRQTSLNRINVGLAVGKLTGSAARIEYLVSTGSVTMTSSSTNASIVLGGVAGILTESSTMLGCTFEGDIAVETAYAAIVGGIVGSASGIVSRAVLAECWSNFTLSATSCGRFGGIVGNAYRVTIIKCEARDMEMAIEADDSFDVNVGGVMGGTSGYVDVSLSSATGQITVNSQDNVWAGGLLGHNYSDDSVENCFAVVNISVYSTKSISIGGLIARSSGTVRNCYSAGELIAQNTSYSMYVGGLTAEGWGVLENCFTLANVTTSTEDGITYIGAIVTGSQESMTNCYKLDEQTLVGDSEYLRVDNKGIVATRTELHTASFVINTIGFSTSVWDIVNHRLPSLRREG